MSQCRTKKKLFVVDYAVERNNVYVMYLYILIRVIYPSMLIYVFFTYPPVSYAVNVKLSYI